MWLHVQDALTQTQLASPQQPPGSAVSAQPQLDQANFCSGSLHIHGDKAELPGLFLPDIAQLNSPLDNLIDCSFIDQELNGSVLYNLRLDAADFTRQVHMIHQLVTRLIGQHDSGIGFDLTFSLQKQVLNISRQTGKGSQVMVGQLLRPHITAAYLSNAAPHALRVEGHYLLGANLWCFRDHETAVEHLHAIGSSSDVLPQPGMSAMLLKSSESDMTLMPHGPAKVLDQPAAPSANDTKAEAGPTGDAAPNIDVETAESVQQALASHDLEGMAAFCDIPLPCELCRLACSAG